MSSKYEKYLSRKIVEAKEMDHDGHVWDARTNSKVPFRAGDYSVIEDGKTRIEPGERFRRYFHKVPEVTE